MFAKIPNSMDKFSYISNAHGDYIEGLYETFKSNPADLDPQWQKFFEGFEFSKTFSDGAQANAIPTSLTTKSVNPVGDVSKEISVASLIEAYRNRGHLLANTNPVRKRKDRKPLLALSDFGLTDADLGSVFQAAQLIDMQGSTLAQVIGKLVKIYQSSIGFETGYIRDVEQQKWLKQKIEKEWPEFSPSHDQKKRIFKKLNEAVVFENFLHTKYVGQKRFSLEGGETSIPVLDFIFNSGAALNVQEFVIGMAHRGRLNVLANSMGKTYEQIFSEFEGSSVPDLTMGDGDVKYHMGYTSDQTTMEGHPVHL